MIGIIFFFCKIIYLQLIAEEKIVKYRLTSAGVISPKQRCEQKNNCFEGLKEDKGLFSKFSLVTRKREGGGKKLGSVIQFHPQRNLTTVGNILSLSADV